MLKNIIRTGKFLIVLTTILSSFTLGIQTQANEQAARNRLKLINGTERSQAQVRQEFRPRQIPEIQRNPRSEFVKSIILEAQSRITPQANYSGYYLPFPEGTVVTPNQTCVDATDPARSNCVHSGNPVSKYAVDFACNIGDSIRASKPGVLLRNSFENNGWGWFVTIRHTGDSKVSVYAHLNSQSTIPEGTPVTQGQEVGKCGQSGAAGGPHLHFGLFPNNTGQNNEIIYFEECRSEPNCYDGQVQYNKPVISQNKSTSNPVTYKFKKGDRVKSLVTTSPGLAVRNVPCSAELTPARISNTSTLGTIDVNTPTIVTNCSLGVNFTTWWLIKWDNGLTGWSTEGTGTTDYLQLVSSAPVNQPPTVSITNPNAGLIISENTALNITANASDTDGSISKVEFFINSIKIGEDTTSIDGWSYSWNANIVGNVSITAKAWDNVAASTTSSPVVITVNKIEKYLIGDEIKTIVNPYTQIYSSPCDSTQILNNKIYYKSKGTIVANSATVANCSINSGFVTWWQVDFDNGIKGWIPDQQIEKYIPLPSNLGPLTKEYLWIDPNSSDNFINFKYYDQSKVITYEGQNIAMTSCATVMSHYLDKNSTNINLNYIMTPYFPGQMCMMFISRQSISGFEFISLTQTEIQNFEQMLNVRRAI